MYGICKLQFTSWLLETGAIEPHIVSMCHVNYQIQ